MPLAPPPRNRDGSVIPHDAADIAASDGLIRRISEKQIIVDANGQKRISSMAFKAASDGGMSVDLEAQILEARIDPQAFVTTPYWIASVRLVVGEVRAEGLQVGSNPLPPENPYHGEVWGITSRAKQRRLQAMAAWFVAMPGVVTAPV